MPLAMARSETADPPGMGVHQQPLRVGLSALLRPCVADFVSRSAADLLGSYYPALWATAGLMVAGAIIAPLVGPPDVWREQEE